MWSEDLPPYICEPRVLNSSVRASPDILPGYISQSELHRRGNKAASFTHAFQTKDACFLHCLTKVLHPLGDERAEMKFSIGEVDDQRDHFQFPE